MSLLQNSLSRFQTPEEFDYQSVCHCSKTATIQQYANQSGLSAEAQGTLRSAVETVNQLCGTQVSVTDAVNGRLADEHGAIEDVSAALGEYVQKKMDQIRIDAQQENLTAL